MIESDGGWRCFERSASAMHEGSGGREGKRYLLAGRCPAPRRHGLPLKFTEGPSAMQAEVPDRCSIHWQRESSSNQGFVPEVGYRKSKVSKLFWFGSAPAGYGVDITRPRSRHRAFQHNRRNRYGVVWRDPLDPCHFLILTGSQFAW
jgi:hypothetical protein